MFWVGLHGKTLNPVNKQLLVRLDNNLLKELIKTLKLEFEKWVQICKVKLGTIKKPVFRLASSNITTINYRLFKIRNYG